MTALAGEIHADLAAIAPQADHGCRAQLSGSSNQVAPSIAPRAITDMRCGSIRRLTTVSGAATIEPLDSRTITTQVALGIELLADQPNRFGDRFLAHARRRNNL